MKTAKHFQDGEPTSAQLQAWPTDPNQSSLEATPSRDAVELQAYLIYVRQGRPQGRDVQHWLEAEARTLST